MARRRDDLSVAVSGRDGVVLVCGLTRRQQALLELLGSAGAAGLGIDELQSRLQVSLNSLRVLKASVNHVLAETGLRVVRTGHGGYVLGGI